MSKKQEIIGLIDADLLDNGTRHPNLVLLKLAGFFQDNGIPFELILDPQANTLHYTRIYLSCVFTLETFMEVKSMGLACLVRCLTIIYMINLLINKLRKVLNEKNLKIIKNIQ